MDPIIQAMTDKPEGQKPAMPAPNQGSFAPNKPAMPNTGPQGPAPKPPMPKPMESPKPMPSKMDADMPKPMSVGKSGFHFGTILEILILLGMAVGFFGLWNQLKGVEALVKENHTMIQGMGDIRSKVDQMFMKSEAEDKAMVEMKGEMYEAGEKMMEKGAMMMKEGEAMMMEGEKMKAGAGEDAVMMEKGTMMMDKGQMMKTEGEAMKQEGQTMIDQSGLQK